MVAINKSESWEAVVHQKIRQSRCPETTFKKLAVDGMSAWKLLLNLEPDSKILEIGAGIDSQIHHLVSHSRHVFLIDNDVDRLAFSQARQRLQHFSHISFLQCDSEWNLPFPANSLDCIILSRPLSNLFDSGGLPPLFLPLGFVSHAQPLMRLLKETRRVLKDAGQLVTTWDNLLSYRALTALDLKPAQRSTSFGYQRIFKSAGFKQLEIHAYQACDTHLYRLRPIKTARHRLTSTANSPGKPGLRNRRLCVPSFAFIASPSPSPPDTLMDRLQDNITAGLRSKLGREQLHVESHQITRKEKLTITASWGEHPLIIKLPLNSRAFCSESNNVEVLKGLFATAGQTTLFAKPILQGFVNNQCYFVESRLPGQPLSQHLKNKGRLACLEQVEALLKQLYLLRKDPHVRPSPMTDTEYQRLVQDCIIRIYEANHDVGLRRVLESYFQNNLQGIPVALGIQHGDFSVSNLFATQGRISGVIDWETGEPCGLPLLDAINYLDSVHRLFNPGILINQSIPLLASGNWPIKEEKAFLGRCFELYGMDPAHQQVLVHFRWLRHISYLMQFWLRFNRKAQQSFIYDIARQLPGKESSRLHG